MPRPNVILRPERIAIVRKGVPPEVLRGVAAVSVVGGERVPPDGRFSMGWRAPQAVGIIMLDGRRERVDGVQTLLAIGGELPGFTQDPMAGAVAELVGATVLGGGNESSKVVIDDDGVGLPQIETVQDPNARYIDEVDKYLLDKAKATQAAGGDEFRTYVEMQRMVHADLNAQAPFMRNTPPSLVKAVLGNIAAVDVGQPPVQIAYWNGDDVESTACTCTFGFVKSSAASGTLLPNQIDHPAYQSITRGPRVYGVLQWGTRGYAVSAEIDIGQSTQCVVAGSQVLLQVACEANPQLTDLQGKVTEPFGPLKLLGMISPTATSRPNAVVRTRYLDACAPLTTYYIGASIQNAGTITIPNFANGVSVWRSDITVPITLTFVDWSNYTLFTTTIESGRDMLMGAPIPLPGDIAQISVVIGPQGLNATVDVRLIFSLGL